MSYRYQSPSGAPPPHSSFQHYPSSNAHTPSHSAFPNKYGGNHFQSNSNTGFGMGGVGVGVGVGGGMGGVGIHRSVSGSHTIHDSHHSSSSSGWDDSNGASGSSNSQGYEETHSNWENYGAGFTSPSQTTTQHHDSHSITSHHPHTHHPHPHSHSMETPSKSDKMERDGHNDRKLDPNMDLDFGLDLKKLGLDVDDDEERETASQRGGGDGAGEEDTAEEMTTGRTTQSQSSTKRRSKRRSVDEEKEPVINVLSLLYDPPVEGCILKPYVSITDSDGVTTALRANLSEDTVEDESDSPVEWRWYRGQKRICSVASCQGGANLQCLSCLKAKLPVHMAYFCSAKCWKDAWPVHRSLHARNSITPAIVTNSNGETSTSWDCDDADEYTVERPDSPTAISCKYPPPVSNIWAEVARSRSYTPVPEDVGRALRIECAPIIKRGIMVPASEVNEGHHVSNPHISINPAVLAVMNGQIQANLLGNWTRIDTSAVMVAPGPPLPRQVIYRHTNQATSGSPFKVVCFNVLAQIYATNQIYPYCAIWALNWDYRKKILLREICSHNADIICLQEVQANHFDSFFQPGLSKAGYDGIFKRKTRDAVGDMHPDSIDGCAIFYRRERFALMEQYGIEFNEAARQQTSDRKSLRRLLKGNIALVVVLEELTSGGAQPQQRRQRKRRLCVANTHIYWDPEYADVKLWQTWVLCQELEKLVLHRNLPLLLCGDFNSMVDSSVYELLSQERITNKRVYDSDPCGILPDLSELRHRLPLVSLYASIGEPKYTNFTGHFVGVLDYMFFTKTHMVSTSILDVDSESVLRDHTALPSPQFSSDHISLVGELDWLLDA